MSRLSPRRDRSERCSSQVGFALDLGTTTLEGSLVDLGSGEVLASYQCANPQRAYGADVMTRLTLAVRSSDTASRMRAAALGGAGEVLRSLCLASGIPAEHVASGVLVGNTAMHHLAFGLDIAGLAAAPYSAATTKARMLDAQTAAKYGLPPMYAAPLIGSYVGSDAVAGSLATDLTAGPTRMLIDVGTNTEVLLWYRGTMYAASAPAGPAFEGGEISCGMRAGPGAVCSVQLHGGDLRLNVVGEEPAKGICGSGLIDAIAVMREAGALDLTGRLQQSGSLQDRIIVGDKGYPVAFILSPSLSITQMDVRAFQLAKGAIRAAVEILLRYADAAASDLQEILLAGAFGTSVRAENALATGMLPLLDKSAICAVGNTSLAGARLLLASAGSREIAEGLAASAEHVELSLRPDFQSEFLKSLDLQ